MPIFTAPSCRACWASTTSRKRDGKKLKPIEKYGLKTMSIGFMVKEDEAMIWRGPMVQSALTQMMNDVLWAPLDVLVLDMPPGTGDAQLTIAQRVPLKGAVIVSTPQDIALIDAKKGIAMFRKTAGADPGHGRKYERLRLPGLRPCPSYFRPWRRASDGGEDGRALPGRDPAGAVIRETSDEGTPVMVAIRTVPKPRPSWRWRKRSRQCSRGTGRRRKSFYRVIICARSVT